MEKLNRLLQRLIFILYNWRVPLKISDKSKKYRMLFYFQVNDEIEGVHMQQLSDAYAEGRINDETPVYDNLVNSKGALSTDWLKSLKDSWHFRFVKKT